MAQELGYLDRFKNFISSKNIADMGRNLQSGARGLADKFSTARAPKLSAGNARVPTVYDPKLAQIQKLKMGARGLGAGAAAVGTGVMIGKGIEAVAGGANDVMDKRYSRMTPQQKKVKDMTAEEYNAYAKSGYGKGLNQEPTKKEVKQVVKDVVKNDIAPAATKKEQKKITNKITNNVQKQKVAATGYSEGADEAMFAAQDAVNRRALNPTPGEKAFIEENYNNSLKKAANNEFADNMEALAADSAGYEGEMMTPADREEEFRQYLAGRNRTQVNDPAYMMINGDVHGDGGAFRAEQEYDADRAVAKARGLSPELVDKFIKERQSM